MLSKEFEFLILGNSRFGGLYHREQAIACELASRGYYVKFIEEIPSIAAEARRYLSKNFFSYSVRDSNISYLQEMIKIYRPPCIPTFYRNSLTPVIDRMIFKKWFKKTFNRQNWERTILIITFPYLWNGFLNRDLVPAFKIIYDICDILEVSCKTKSALNRALKGERFLLNDVDIVTYSAYSMQTYIQNKFPEVYSVCIPNATNKDFIDIVNQNSEKKIENRNIIGYIGSTDDRWFDTDLYIETLNSCPEYKFILCAPLTIALYRKLKQFKNLNIIGFKSHIEVAKIISDFDVGLIPFKKNTITDAINHLKLYEYCAAGIPIVSIRTLELEHYSEYVYLSQNINDFINNIRVALKENSFEMRLKRKIFAEKNTWTERVNVLLENISYQINKK